jgi:hypothetical protein
LEPYFLRHFLVKLGGFVRGFKNPLLHSGKKGFDYPERQANGQDLCRGELTKLTAVFHLSRSNFLGF